MSDSLKKLKNSEEKIKEYSENMLGLLEQLQIECPGDYRVMLLHPAEHLFIKFLREELIHGKLENLTISNGIPMWTEYKIENGITKRKKFEQDKL